MNKYNNFISQKNGGNIIFCPRCRVKFNAGIHRCVICPNEDCNFKFCKQCREDFHKDEDCAEGFIQNSIEYMKNMEGGVTQCPRCRVPYIKNLGSVHITCLNSACLNQFCFKCLY